MSKRTLPSDGGPLLIRLLPGDPPPGGCIAFQAGVLRADGRMDDPRMLRIRDAYLEPFTSRASRKEPLRRVALARRTGCVTRAISWESALQDAPATVVAAEEFPVRGWLLELLKPWADVD
jgi:hypothetical protein